MLIHISQGLFLPKYVEQNVKVLKAEGRGGAGVRVGASRVC